VGKAAQHARIRTVKFTPCIFTNSFYTSAGKFFVFPDKMDLISETTAINQDQQVEEDKPPDRLPRPAATSALKPAKSTTGAVFQLFNPHPIQSFQTTSASVSIPRCRLPGLPGYF
jgi:hypothetical protein